MLTPEFDCACFPSAEAALEDALRLCPDLILSDLVMDGMSGLDLCGRVRAEPSLCRVPVVLLTSKAEEGDRALGLECGADDYLYKPVRPRELLARARSLVRLRRSALALECRTAEVERANSNLVEARDALVRSEKLATLGAEQLARANSELEATLEQHRQTHHQLVEASRKAGMADVASAVLHNVGNVLNSVSVAATVIGETARRSRGAGVARLAALVAGPEFEAILGAHPKTKQLPTYLAEVALALAREQETLTKEAAGLKAYIDHISAIVSAQQAHAKGVGSVLEEVALGSLVEEALVLDGLDRPIPGLRIKRDFGPVPAVLVDRHLVLQIVVNLLSNAFHAARGNGREEGTITVRLFQAGPRIHLAVQDDGYGIAPENLTRVFGQGFTTKPSGHGFGLHSCANAAREMGGWLTCASEGTGRGATFVLELPVERGRAAA